MPYQNPRNIGIAFLAALLASSPTGAQDLRAPWLKCDVIKRVQHNSANSSQFAKDHTLGYFQIDGAILLRLSKSENGQWNEDRRCETDVYGRRLVAYFACRITPDSVGFREDQVRYRSDARTAIKAGEEPSFSGEYSLVINRRDGTFRYDRTEYAGSREAGETSRGTCRRVDDPRPAAKF